MSRTVGQCIGEARGHLNDTVEFGGSYRYTDADLYLYFGNAVLEARRMRPDLFLLIGLTTTVPQYSPTADVNTPFPIDETYFPAFAYYIAGKAELRDDEFNTDGRAAQFLAGFRSMLVGGA